MEDLVKVKLITKTKGGTRIKVPATLRFDSDRIWFVESPFALKDEIKSMRGSRWHGYEDPPMRMWSVANCERNNFQLQWLMGQNPYEWWDRPLQSYDYERPLRDHQCLMSDHMLTYHFMIIAAEMGLGKTLSAIECMERSGHKDWWWVCPKSGIKAATREFQKWGLADYINLEIMTYERLRSIMESKWKDGDVPPPGVIFDESSRLKNHSAKRTQAAQALADGIREHYGKDGYVIEMSGTPSPKSPIDWWSQAEIAWPGFLREGNAKAFEWRLGIFAEQETMQGKHFKRIAWLDDEAKCKHCGEYEDADQHRVELAEEDFHSYAPSVNEVAYLNERLKGLVLVLHKKDCLDLPEKQYRVINLQPTATVQRVAKAMVKLAPNAITGLTWMRELSDGFQYQDVEDGTEPCPICKNGTVQMWQDPDDEARAFEMVDMLDPKYVETLIKVQVICPNCNGSCEVPKIVRITKEVPCPKDEALKQLLEENEEQGRLAVFAGFTGTLDRITKLCLAQRWAVVRVDGRGWVVFNSIGNTVREVQPLDYWADLERNPRVAYVAHPRSGGLSITLTETRMAVFYSNDFNPESRAQAEDRIHRIGMDENKGATIVDLFHLPTDEKVRNILLDNRRLELMTLGEVQETFET